MEFSEKEIKFINYFLKEVEKRPELKNALNNNNWDEVYETVRTSVNIAFPIWLLTKLFTEAGIDVLKDRDDVPSYWFSHWVGDLVIPEGIKVIDRHSITCPKINKLYIPSTVEKFVYNMFGDPNNPLFYIEELIYNGTEEQFKEVIKNSGPWMDRMPNKFTFKS